MKILSKIYIALIILFLYAPVAVMIVFSFNSSSSVWVFDGFSTRWYEGLANDTTMLTALEHTLIIAVLSAVAMIARPIASAKPTGTAFPICLYFAEVVPTKTHSSGNCCILAYSCTLNGLFALG